MRATVFVLAILLGFTSIAVAAPDGDSLRRWAQCVAATEARLRSERTVPARPHEAAIGGVATVWAVVSPEPACDTGVSHATIQRWSGAVFVPRITVDDLVRSLQHRLPEQQDVVGASFLGGSDDALRVYLRLVRKKIITVVYDTEHDLTFDRRSPDLAFSRSEMVRVAEVEAAGTERERVRAPGDDRGFLWKLNSYSTYLRAGDGVLVRIDSLTLSRDVPFLLRPVAGAIIDSIARESMLRTLEGLQRRGAPR